jgi:hypothetical protein
MAARQVVFRAHLFGVNDGGAEKDIAFALRFLTRPGRPLHADGFFEAPHNQALGFSRILARLTQPTRLPTRP